ncbi:MAG: peptidoglycan editing factor PgeF [Proteobacteria bacterium]|nr:peptidoglycan editing factor PgeF [Pseudomonadota bacterium]
MAPGPGIIAPDWPAPAGVRAAFTLRTGGVSVAPYDSLNMGAAIGDSPEAVAENRRRVRDALRLPAEPGWLEQVHGVEVVALGAATGVAGGGEAGARGVGAGRDVAAGVGREAAGGVARVGVVAAGALPRGDASVAWGPGQVCAIRVADCMPVLFAAADGSVVGAAHAGWRGLAGGVLEATVERMGVPASRLIAWMGPAIGQPNFEVGDDVRAAFMATDLAAASAFVANARGRWQCDLYALARRRLTALGVAGIYGGGWCTFADSERFFSYRRSGQCGRMAALIWIEAG